MAGGDWPAKLKILQDKYNYLCRLRTEPYRRWANGFSCLCFALVGAPVAIRLRNADFLSSFFICFLPILVVYYPLMALGVDGAGVLPPYAVWLGNIILVVVGIWWIRRVVDSEPICHLRCSPSTSPEPSIRRSAHRGLTDASRRQMLLQKPGQFITAEVLFGAEELRFDLVLIRSFDMNLPIRTLTWPRVPGRIVLWDLSGPIQPGPALRCGSWPRARRSRSAQMNDLLIVPQELPPWGRLGQ